MHTSPLAVLTGAEADASLHDMHAFLTSDPELAALFTQVDAGTAYGWLRTLLEHALGRPVSGVDSGAARICAQLHRAPDLEARFVNYLTGILLLNHAPRAAVIDLRQTLVATVHRFAVGPPVQPAVAPTGPVSRRSA